MSATESGAADAAIAADADVIVCRCEAVTFAALRAAVERLRVGSVRGLKLATRAGMGICQGRVCRPALEGAAVALGLGVDEGGLSVRPPLRPVSLGALAQLDAEDRS